MNKIIIQLWEILIDSDIYSDGCSIHIDQESYSKYIDNNTDRKMGRPFDAFVSDDIFNKLKSNHSLRLCENELNNLLSFEEIIVKNA